MFTLVIFCLTTSNLPWFMDLTFQVPMQYCSLQHRTLLPSPVPFTTGCCFCFGSIPSFFLELFLHWSQVAYWVSTNLGSSSFSVISFCLFILFMCVIFMFIVQLGLFIFPETNYRIKYIFVTLRLSDSIQITKIVQKSIIIEVNYMHC